MGKKSRDKGNAFEVEVVNANRKAGRSAERVPLSGAAKGSFQGDVHIDGLIGECKIQANGFKQIYGWLDHDEEVDFLVIRADRQKRLYVIPEDLWNSFMGCRSDLLNSRASTTHKFGEASRVPGGAPPSIERKRPADAGSRAIEEPGRTEAEGD